MSWPSQCFNARHVIEQFDEFDGRPPWKKSLVVLRRLASLQDSDADALLVQHGPPSIPFRWQRAKARKAALGLQQL